MLFCAALSGAKAKLGSWGTVARVTDASPALGVDRGCLDDALGGWVLIGSLRGPAREARPYDQGLARPPDRGSGTRRQPVLPIGNDPSARVRSWDRLVYCSARRGS